MSKTNVYDDFDWLSRRVERVRKNNAKYRESDNYHESIRRSNNKRQQDAARYASNTSKRWTEDDDNYLIEHNGEPIASLAQALGRGYWSVCTRRSRLGLSQDYMTKTASDVRRETAERQRRWQRKQQQLTGDRATRTYTQWTTHDDDFILNNMGKLTHSEMALKLGRTRDAVAARVHRLRRDKQEVA